MSGEHQTTLLISEEQRADWEEYVGENPEFNSKADLIRRAVEKEIHSEDDQDAVVDHTEAVSEVQNEVRQLRALVEDLQTTVEAIEARTREPTREIKDLTSEVFAVLPEGEEQIREWQRGEVPPETRHESNPTAHSGSLTAIANVVDEDESRVEQALGQLRDDSYRVQTVEIDGERRWYKEV